jgi:ABC-2 type transport system ATP-binding protein
MPYDASSSTANAWNIFLAQTWAEILQLMRTPTYLAGVLLLSSLAVFIPSSEPEAIQPSMLFLSAFCLLTFSIDRLGKRIAIERVEGWLKLLRVTPLPPSLYIAAKLAMTMALLVVSLATIFGICIFKHGLEQSNMAWVKIWLGLLVGIIPFTLLGITLGYSVPPKALDSITGLLIPTAMFFSGQWPMPSPAYLQDITVVLPFFHYAQLIKSAAGILPINHLALSVAWLILYGILAGLMAKLAYQRDAVT